MGRPEPSEFKIAYKRRGKRGNFIKKWVCDFYF